MLTVKIRQMISKTSGNPVSNQFIIEDNKLGARIQYFQSYDSIIVKIDWGTEPKTITLDEHYWDYSNTTSKYRNQFLDETTKETRKKIESGEYKLANLN